LTRIKRDEQRLNAIASRSNRTPFASVEFVLRHDYLLLRARHQRELVEFDALPSNPVELRDSRDAEGESAQRDAAFEDIRNWRASSLLMQQLLAPRASLHPRLQPNQYLLVAPFATTSGGSRSTTRLRSSWRERGYPFLEKGSSRRVQPCTSSTTSDGRLR